MLKNPMLNFLVELIRTKFHINRILWSVEFIGWEKSPSYSWDLLSVINLRQCSSCKRETSIPIMFGRMY